MDILAILQLTSSLKVSLWAKDGRLLATPGVNVTPELGEAIRANKPALLAIVGSRSWPWLGDPACVLSRMHCACCVQVEYKGRIDYLPIHAFTRLGEPLCVGCIAKRIGGAALEVL